MIIGIDGSRAFIKKRTGIEEYSYQVIKHLRGKIKNHQVVLYIRYNQAVDFDLSENLPAGRQGWKVKKLWAPRFWTQIRLSLEMIFNPVDILFVPAHTAPLIHPARNALLSKLFSPIRKLVRIFSSQDSNKWRSMANGPKDTIVTIHGLEYEVFPRSYSAWENFYMRESIKNSCKWANKIIAVSQNTKKDLVKFYKTPEEKITVIYEGYEQNIKYQISNIKINEKIEKPYLLFVGRLEKRKNIVGIIKTFEMLKEKYNIPHKLVLVGGKGYGFEEVESEKRKAKSEKDIIITGYVSEEKKWELLKNADVFLFPTFYEGFGIPVLEAQSVGTPVVAGNNSSIPEISTNYESGTNIRIRSALLVDPNNHEQIAETTYRLISDENLKNDIINKGYENVKRFSWEKCASEVAELLE
ncbi:capsular glucan synthase [bacterium BMS3Abin15]|nr:capsular glucan synthase [bacterium BMS3Abin15]HDH07557.1 glycosyltransferase family 1 protein [Candidatus Moranbacteria bacterium]HDZ85302.1 glycosyltransferase family 1 protein [Candidatus Moranbacteria bacterium]